MDKLVSSHHFFFWEWVTYNIYGLVGHFIFRPIEFFRGLGVILETQALKCYKLCILLKRRKEKNLGPLVLPMVPSVLIIIDIQVK